MKTLLLLALTSIGSASGYSQDEPTAVLRETVGMRVPADHAKFGFTLRALDREPNKAVVALEQAVAALKKRLPGATIEPESMTFDAAQKTGALTGRIEVVFPAADYWSRAKLLGDLSTAFAAFGAEQGKVKVQSDFTQATVSIRDVERLRAELLKAWSAKAKEFIAAAPTPLRLGDCVAPGEVQQAEVSLTTVAVTMEVACRLEAAVQATVPKK